MFVVVCYNVHNELIILGATIGYEKLGLNLKTFNQLVSEMSWSNYCLVKEKYQSVDTTPLKPVGGNTTPSVIPLPLPCYSPSRRRIGSEMTRTLER